MVIVEKTKNGKMGEIFSKPVVVFCCCCEKDGVKYSHHNPTTRYLSIGYGTYSVPFFAWGEPMSDLFP